MWIIKSINVRKVLNSHVKFTNEFIVTFSDGSFGIGTSPQGETISIYEDKNESQDSTSIIAAIKKTGLIGNPQSQESFDNSLQQNIPIFGRSNAYGLSLAFFNATNKTKSIFELFENNHGKPVTPYLCFNLLNGGYHAYTNPVLSDFPEYILVSKNDDVEEAIGNHNEVQRLVKERLAKQSKTIISGNTVNSFSHKNNSECIEFLLNICENLGLSNSFDLMIDASGGDLWTGNGYKLSISDGTTLTSSEFCEYWLDIIRQYNLKFLEDPFHEQDFSSWNYLSTFQKDCAIIGDNLYSTNKDRIKEGALKQYTHGVVVKPNQAGTVTSVKLALETAQSVDQIVITSHRSISTESVFLSILTCMYGVKYIKIGPLQTDFSSIVRLNEIIRLTREVS